MTYKELKDRFIKGEPIERFFGIRKTTQTMGTDKVTDTQLNKLRQELDVNTEIYSGGFTRHIITYKPEHDDTTL